MNDTHKISTIFFDAGGVLFDTTISRKERIRRLLRIKGFDGKNIEAGLLKGDEYYSAQFEVHNNISNWEEEEEKWLGYYEAILLEVANNTQVLKKQLLYQTHYAAHCILFDDVIAVLSRLQGKYKLGVISNAFPSLDWIFDSLDIRKYFDNIVISAFAGVRKPENAIYELALDSLGVKAQECIFIDDRLENVETANKIGIIGVHLERSITNLGDIIDKLKL